MMNACLTDLYCVRNVGVAESGIPSIDKEGVSGVKNPFCRFTLHIYVDYQLVELDADFFADP